MVDTKLYRYLGLFWDVEVDYEGYPIGIALCPNCKCKLTDHPDFWGPEVKSYEYRCIKCEFKKKFSKDIKHNGRDFLTVLEAEKYKDAEVVNLDGDLVRIQRGEIKDDDYWIDAKISKNNKGEKQLMVLAGSKKTTDKVQLFLDHTHERLSFDQNDSHPKEIFAKVTATFNNSSSHIEQDPKNIIKTVKPAQPKNKNKIITKSKK